MEEPLMQLRSTLEIAVMMRMLGPHQAIRLERLRTELDDVLEQALLEQSNQSPMAKVVPNVPSDIAYEQQQGW